MSKSGLTSLLSQNIEQNDTLESTAPAISVSNGSDDQEIEENPNDNISFGNFPSSFGGYSSLGATPAGTPSCTPIKPSPLLQMASTPNTIQNALSGLGGADYSVDRQRPPSFTSASPGSFLTQQLNEESKNKT